MTAPYGARVRRPRGDRDDGRAGHRPRAPGRQLDGRARGDRGRPASARTASAGSRCSAPPSPSSAATGTGSCASPARSSGMLPHSLGRDRVEQHLLGAVRRPRPGRPGDGRHRRRRVRAHLPLARRAARVPRPAPARSTSRTPFGRKGFYPRLSELQPPALFVWASHDRLIPERFRHHVERWLPRRRAGRARGLRPRPAGRGAQAHQRPARAILRPRRPARRAR